MFLFVMLQCNIKSYYNFDFWLSAILYIAMNLCIKQSGAHYNPVMTVSNFVIKFGPPKLDLYFIWTYFKAEFIPAFLAYHISFHMRGYYAPPMAPDNFQASMQIIMSEFIGTFTLSLLLQKVCNTQTTWTTSDAEMQGFVIVYVFVARRFAILSGNSINPVTALAAASAAILQCDYSAINCIHLYLIGDYCGSIAGSLFYNHLYEPNLQRARFERTVENNGKYWNLNLSRNQASGRISSLSNVIRKMQLEDQELDEINKQSDIRHKSDSSSEDDFRLGQQIASPPQHFLS